MSIPKIAFLLFFSQCSERSRNAQFTDARHDQAGAARSGAARVSAPVRVPRGYLQPLGAWGYPSQHPQKQKPVSP